MKFAVVQVYQDYDYVEEVKCLDVFDKEEEAIGYIKGIKDRFAVSWQGRDSYITNFVEKIDVPQNPTYQEWQDFLIKYPIHSVTPKNFKIELKDYLRIYTPKLEGYSPPTTIFDSQNLFVVKIEKI